MNDSPSWLPSSISMSQTLEWELVTETVQHTTDELRRVFDTLPSMWQNYIIEWIQWSFSNRISNAINSLLYLKNHRANRDWSLLTEKWYIRLQELALDDKFFCFYTCNYVSWSHTWRYTPWFCTLCADTMPSNEGVTVYFDKEWNVIDWHVSEDVSIL